MAVPIQAEGVKYLFLSIESGIFLFALFLGNKMTTENDYAKLKELMEFPAKMTFKVAGVNREGLAQDLVQVVQKYIKGDYIPKEKRSSKGTYNSVSIDIIAENFEQVETLYKELAKVEGVKMVI